MPFVEFSRIEGSGEMQIVPAGVYTVVVDHIEERRTQSGDPLWRVGLRIQGGGRPEFHGRRVFDNWVFSPKALPRIKLIASCFGLDVDSDREISPKDFLGKEIEVEVKTRKSVGAEEREESFVPYAGYRKGEEVPF
jgi:hypothetical protein